MGRFSGSCRLIFVGSLDLTFTHQLLLEVPQVHCYARQTNDDLPPLGGCHFSSFPACPGVVPSHCQPAYLLHRFCFQCLPPPHPDQSCSPIKPFFPKYGNSTLTVWQTTARLSGVKQRILSHEPLGWLSISSTACGVRLSAQMPGSQKWPQSQWLAVSAGCRAGAQLGLWFPSRASHHEVSWASSHEERLEEKTVDLSPSLRTYIASPLPLSIGKI